MIRNNNSFISENYILLGTPLTRQSDIESIIHNAKIQHPEQFAGKKVESFSVVKDGSGSGDDAKIDAISGATITSKAVTGAMNSCLAYFQSLEGGN